MADHVHHHIGGQAPAAVGEPLDQVRVLDGGHADGPALVVDLGGVVRVLKLADHVAQRAHLAVAQVLGGLAVQGGYLVKGDLGHLLGEAAVFHGEQVPVGRRPEDGHGQHVAHQRHRQHRHEQNGHGQAAAFDEAQPLPQLFPARHLHRGVQSAGQQEDAAHVYQAQKAQEAVKLRVVQVEGGQGDVEAHKAHQRGHSQAEQGAAQAAAGKMEAFHRRGPPC